jgi:CheY-like chemotaxis protein
MLGFDTTNRPGTTTTVAIVDPRPADYLLPQGEEPRDVGWRLLTTACKALQLARKESVDLWVLNTVLPDMSGFDLCAMLRNCWPRSVIYVVTDDYSAAEERTARISGATLFACKTLFAETGGLSQFLPSRGERRIENVPHGRAMRVRRRFAGSDAGEQPRHSFAGWVSIAIAWKGPPHLGVS